MPPVHGDMGSWTKRKIWALLICLGALTLTSLVLTITYEWSTEASAGTDGSTRVQSLEFAKWVPMEPPRLGLACWVTIPTMAYNRAVYCEEAHP